MRTGVSRQAFMTLLAVVTLATAGTVAVEAAAAEDYGPEIPCQFKDPDLGPCVPNTRHDYAGQCQGIDCYSALEFCCLPTLIFRIPPAK